MPAELDQEILTELKKLNERLDRLNKPRGLSTPMKFVALFLGYVVLGPIITYLIFTIFN